MLLWFSLADDCLFIHRLSFSSLLCLCWKRTFVQNQLLLSNQGSEAIILLEFKPYDDIINYSILYYIVNAIIKSIDYIVRIKPMSTLCVDNRFAVHTDTQVENAINIFQVSHCVLLLGMILQKMNQTGWKLCSSSFSDSWSYVVL